MGDKMECYRREFKHSMEVMGRMVHKLPEFEDMVKDPEIGKMIGAATEQHAKYYAKRICGMKKHPLAGAPKRRRRKSRK